MNLLVFVTIGSVLLAIATTAVAWRVWSEERRRSEARVAALAADIYPRADAPLGRATISHDLFIGEPAKPPAARLASVLATGILVVVAAVSLVVVLSGSGRRAESRTADAGPAQAANPAAVPLELVALGHERSGDRLTVRGVVRNPAQGGEVDHLTAVVFLFDGNGGFISTGRAAVDADALVAGGEAAFIVAVADAGNVGRYRVSFRAGDRVIPHVDRRAVDRNREEP